MINHGDASNFAFHKMFTKKNRINTWLFFLSTIHSYNSTLKRSRIDFYITALENSTAFL